MNNESDSNAPDATAPVAARSYTLPRRFLYPEIALFSFITALAGGAWIPAVYSEFKIGSVLSTALRAAIFPSVTAALLLILVLYVKYELGKTGFFLTDEFLIRASPMKLRKLRLAGIESVSLVKLPFSGGMLAVKNGQQTIFVPFILRHSRDLVRRIEEACIETAIAATVDTAMWPQAHRRSTLTGKAVKRSSRSYQSLLTISITMLPFAVITGMFFWDLDLIPLMLWSVIAPILPLIAFATADLTLRIREERAFTAPKNDAATRVDIDEESTFVRSGIFFAILYLIAGIVYKASAQ